MTGNTFIDAWTDTVGGLASPVAIRSNNNMGVVAGNTLQTSGAKTATYLNTKGLNVASGSAREHDHGGAQRVQRSGDRDVGCGCGCVWD